MSLKLSRTVVCAWLVAASMVPSVAAFSQTAPETAAVNTDAPPVTDTPTTTSPHRVIEKGGLKETEDVSKFEGLKERIGRCTGTKERSDRLTCYDTIAQRLGFTNPQSTEKVKGPELIEEVKFWKITEKRAVTGELMTYARLDSNNTVLSKAGAESNVTLTLRCQPGKTDVMIDWKNVISDRIQEPKSKLENPRLLLSYQVDNGDKVSEYWDISLDKRAIFAPYPVEFVRKIIDSRLLSFVVVPPGEAAIALSFDSDGVRRVSEIIVERCYNPNAAPDAKTAQ